MADAFASGGVPQPPAKKHKRTCASFMADGDTLHDFGPFPNGGVAQPPARTCSRNHGSSEADTVSHRPMKKRKKGLDGGHNGSDGLSDASRALLALARAGDKEACEALHRLAKSGRGSAIGAQRALFAERLARAQVYRTLQEWANGAILVSRTQFPVFAKMQCTLHGVHGKTADPSFIAHWTFPPGLMKRQWESNHCD